MIGPPVLTWTTRREDADLAGRTRAAPEIYISDVEMDTRAAYSARVDRNGAMSHGEPTAEQQRRRNVRFRTAVHVAWVGTLAMGAWAWLVASPYAIAMLVACPWLALHAVARSGGRLTIYSRRLHRYPASIAIAFVFPGLFLTLDSVRSVKLLSWETATVISACVTAGLWFAALKMDPVVRLKAAYTITAFLLCAPYGYGLTTEANARLDATPPAIYSARITGKHVTHGRGSTGYKLDLEPWGPQSHPDRVSVPRALYRATEVNDEICVDLKRGALRIGWYVVRRCR